MAGWQNPILFITQARLGGGSEREGNGAPFIQPCSIYLIQFVGGLAGAGG